MAKLRDQDGGWAWVILCACAINVLVTTGLCILAGMFQIVFLEHFAGGLVMTSWITSIFASLLQLAGPLAGIISSAVSCRAGIMSGGALLTLGLLLSAYSTDLLFLLFTFGISGGLGLGLIYSPSVVAVNLCFMKYRPIATGTVTAAGGIGIIGAPALCRFLLETYSFRETLIILAGISAHLVITGAVLFPPNGKSCESGYVGKVWQRLTHCHKQRRDQHFEGISSKQAKPLLPNRGPDTPDPRSWNRLNEDNQDSHSKQLMLLTSKEISQSPSQPMNTEQRSRSPHRDGVACRRLSEDNDKEQTPYFSDVDSASVNVLQQPLSESDIDTRPDDVSTEKYNQTSFNDEIVLRLDNSEGDDEDKSTSVADCPHKNFRVASENTTETVKKFTFAKCLVTLSNPSIILICAHLFLCNAAIGIVLIHYVAFCLEGGSSMDAASWAFSMNGVTLTLGRFFLGMLGQDVNVDLLSAYIGCGFVASTLVLLMPVLAVTRVMQIAMLGFLGLYAGGSFSLLSEITIHCAGVDTLGMTFGLEMVASGLGYLVAPPIAGVLVNITKSYGNAILLAGVLYFISTLVALCASLSRPSWTPGRRSYETDR